MIIIIPISIFSTLHEFDFNEEAKLIINSTTFSGGIFVVRSFAPTDDVIGIFANGRSYIIVHISSSSTGKIFNINFTVI